MFKFNSITSVLRAEEVSAEAPLGAQAAFNPSVVNQGVGVFDSMKEQAKAQQTSQEETGSVSVEATSDPVVDDKATDEQVDPVVDKVAEKAVDASSDPVVDDKTEVADTGYTYKGLAVEVNNTPEMVESFKEKGLDIDDVNKELYSKDGITADTRTKLDEAFGKMSVDMYLEGLESKNEAMLATHTANAADQTAKIDAVVKESTGDNYDAVMKWANDNLDAKQYSDYADIINGDNSFQIGLALKDLTAQSGLQSNKLDQPEVKVKVVEELLSADVTETKNTSTAITAKEYHDAIVTGEYKKDMAGWDARRQAGLDSNI